MTSRAAGPELERVRETLREIDDTVQALDVYPSDSAAEIGPSVGRRRRMRRRGFADPVGALTLILNDDGVLLWHDGPPGSSLPGRRSRRGSEAPRGKIVEIYQFEKLEPNQVGSFLRKLDSKLNPNSGLRRLKGGVLVSTERPQGKKRRLVLVHGTFSKSENILTGIKASPTGAAFLAKIESQYDEVLVFDHPTLSVSPLLNAYDLSREFAATSGPLDVVAHSRGGLVTRWWLEGFRGAATGPTRAVLVGSPLGGTSLASPPRLKDALSVLSNFGTALKLAGAATSVYVPFLAAPVALLKIACSVTSLVSKTPLVDAAVSMIPGLAGQSRVAENPEIVRLQKLGGEGPQLFAVRSDFETENPGWKFWRYFRKDKMLDAGADRIFAGPNDLVVDTASMTEVSKAAFPAGNLLDYGTSDTIHHTNYFEQPRTLQFIGEKLSNP